MMKSGGMMSPEWTINGQAYPNAMPLDIHQGEAVRIRMVNESAMPHPMHLHGHFFRVGNVTKDTAIIWTHTGRVEFDFIANNPGTWFFHCHNLYHMEAGMARLFRYESVVQ
jgi:FtsP/CotA-like multicopper oxidase with cupredoxin domain